METKTPNSTEKPKIKRLSLTYRILRAIIVTLTAFVTLVPVGLYVALSTPWAQEKMREVAQKELSNAMGTEVTIGRVDFAPFNRIRVTDIAVTDDNGVKAVKAANIAARFELIHFLKTRRIVIDYAAIDRLDARLYRSTASAPLNIARIIEKLTRKEPNKPPSRFDLAISTVLISESAVRYDVLDAPHRQGRLDPHHLSFSDISLAASLPVLRNDAVVVNLDQLSLREQSGLDVRSLRVNVLYTPTRLDINGFDLLLPQSHIALSDISIGYSSPKEIAKTLKDKGIHIATAGDSYITPADLAAVVPALKDIPGRHYLDIDVTGDSNRLSIDRLKIENRQNGLFADVTGAIAGYARKAADSITAEDLAVQLRLMPGSTDWVTSFVPDSKAPALRDILRNLGKVSVSAKANGSLAGFDATADIATAAGSLVADVNSAVADKRWTLSADFEGKGLRPSAIVRKGELAHLENVSLNGTFDGSFGGGRPLAGDAGVTVSSAVFNGYTFNDIEAELSLADDRTFSGILAMGGADGANDANGTADLEFEGGYGTSNLWLRTSGKLKDLALAPLGVKGKYNSYRLSADIDADLQGTVTRWINGYADIANLSFTGDGKALNLRRFRVETDNVHHPNIVTVESDFLNGRLQGSINLGTLPAQARDLFARAMPVFADPHAARTTDPGPDNNFHFEFRIADAENITNFLGLPVDIIHPVTIDGAFSNADGTATVTVDAPYLQQKDKIIENTTLQASLTRSDGRGIIYATTTYPTQKGVMTVNAGITASNNRIDNKLDWQIEREKPIKGLLSMSMLVGRGYDDKLNADIDINTSTITFGNAEWTIAPARVLIDNNTVSVENFALTTEGQSVRIEGSASNDSDSQLRLTVDNLELINIFKTLDINNALIGGRATGIFYATQLMSKTPAIWCNGLNVKNISYNDCVMGEANVDAHLDNERGAFHLDALIDGPDNNRSHIAGDILLAGALDMDFDANHIPVGFMKPFMSAFADDLSGHASGHARLFGTFQDIDLEGVIFADSLGLKLGFTNTWYYATDSVHIKPGVINLKNITLRDRYGNTAMLNGYVRHKCFHKPEFEFRVTDARKLLVYDVTPKLSPIWYGRVFGDGTAHVKGRPGVVDIDVAMTTTEGSTFTFVLSDDEEADEYSFITFRDKTPKKAVDAIMASADSLPKAVLEYRERMRARHAVRDLPTAYNMDIQVDVTPVARVIIVMDPVGGDEIKANGTGDMRLTYNNSGNELHMYGTYAIERGSYNFTLQDIIRKDFTINQGSSISFTGDPYAARLDINATYNVNANLSDLDESFLQDKDLNRTTVPVSAVLMASGDMRQPDIRFDLAFPTLNSDIYRKVRSIVSTDEMMNRQIIYLLALNRFYTPEYMSTTKGNELFSVASSTIASQLSGMLGKLSENWSIAPNLRSDRGDFSDVEFDVALSSSLLNNRLLFNGNFGYRDKSLNTNQFIGDFDIEYLLNRSGSIRLKAYNRYNDQNYYLRTAQTTQGVGVMFKRDFDNMFAFLHRRKKPRDEANGKDGDKDGDKDNATGNDGDNNNPSTKNKPTLKDTPAARDTVPADTIPAAPARIETTPDGNTLIFRSKDAR
ncbi:MAG: translocation/assembly module TamB domain-containing protein [Muribaculaceae bacterium]